MGDGSRPWRRGGCIPPRSISFGLALLRLTQPHVACLIKQNFGTDEDVSIVVLITQLQSG